METCSDGSCLYWQCKDGSCLYWQCSDRSYIYWQSQHLYWSFLQRMWAADLATDRVTIDLVSQDPVTNDDINQNYVSIDVVAIHPVTNNISHESVSDYVFIHGSSSNDVFIQDSIDVLLRDWIGIMQFMVAMTQCHLLYFLHCAEKWLAIKPLVSSDIGKASISQCTTSRDDDDFYYDCTGKFKIIKLEKSDTHHGKTKKHNITRLLGHPQPQMYPPVAINQYTWVNRTPKHFIYMLQGPTHILK